MPRTGKTGGHKVINSVQQVDSSATTRDDVHIEMRKTHNKVKTKVSQHILSPKHDEYGGGERRQEMARTGKSLGSPAMPYKPRLHVAGKLKPGHPGIHTTSLFLRSHHQELWSSTKPRRVRLLLLKCLLRSL